MFPIHVNQKTQSADNKTNKTKYSQSAQRSQSWLQDQQNKGSSSTRRDAAPALNSLLFAVGTERIGRFKRLALRLQALLVTEVKQDQHMGSSGCLVLGGVRTLPLQASPCWSHFSVLLKQDQSACPALHKTRTGTEPRSGPNRCLEQNSSSPAPQHCCVPRC